jgi:phosphopantothenoylcysteine decarboxylase/phosphopantothenate--cysteine ligase
MTDTNSKLAGLNILLGVTGGVAAYKAVDLASKLTAAGAKVTSVLTRNARKLATAKSFEAVTGRQVFTRLFNTPSEYHIGHISLAESADIVVIAPATANIIAKIANGICNDLLSTILCACWEKPVLIAPAMNNQMWTNPAVRRNIETIKKMNFQFIGPKTGRLACGTDAIGRMAEPADIVIALQQIAEKIKKP